MIDPEKPSPLWTMLFLDKWSLVVNESRLSKSWNVWRPCWSEVAVYHILAALSKFSATWRASFPAAEASCSPLDLIWRTSIRPGCWLISSVTKQWHLDTVLYRSVPLLLHMVIRLCALAVRIGVCYQMIIRPCAGNLMIGTSDLLQIRWCPNHRPQPL